MTTRAPALQKNIKISLVQIVPTAAVVINVHHLRIEETRHVVVWKAHIASPMMIVALIQGFSNFSVPTTFVGLVALVMMQLVKMVRRAAQVIYVVLILRTGVSLVTCHVILVTARVMIMYVSIIPVVAIRRKQIVVMFQTAALVINVTMVPVPLIITIAANYLLCVVKIGLAAVRVTDVVWGNQAGNVVV